MILTLLAAAVAQPTPAPAAAPAGVDPLTVRIETADVERFAKVFRASNGKPSATDLKRAYLDPGTRGVAVFTPGRIRSAEHLAKTIASDPAFYARALDVCLPVVAEAQADLRAIYLALSGLFPGRPLPSIYVVIGANNSGGTAAPGAQVLGLETLCAVSNNDPAKLRDILRTFFAHETVHSLQRDIAPVAGVSPLLTQVLAEGAADFIAAMVTGAQPDPARAAWAAPRERELWMQFEEDLAATADYDPAAAKGGDPRQARMLRWVWNYGAAPDGWPVEAGYWVGQRIWQRYYDAAPDKHAAVLAMIDGADPREVLAAGRLR